MDTHDKARSQQLWAQQAREAEAWMANLLQRHPALFAGKNLAAFVGSSAVPEGWQAIIDNLLSRITACLTPQEQRAFEPLQIKEKFGCLRFYFRLRKPRREAAWPDDAGLDEWRDEEDEEEGEADGEEVAPPPPPREYLRIQFGHDAQYALYAPQAGYGVDLARATRLQGLQDLVREAEMLTGACCIRCGAQHLPLLCIRYGYVRTLCFHCAAQADDYGQVPRHEMRQTLARGLDEARSGKRRGRPQLTSFWRLIEDGEMEDYVALIDLPPAQQARFQPHLTATHSLLGEMLPAEVFLRQIGSWNDDCFARPLPSGSKHITVGAYWKRRFVQPFPTLPPAELVLPGVFESIVSMFGDAVGHE